MQNTPENYATLAEWLAHAERLHPKSIDMGLARVKAVAMRMGLQFDCPIITVAGTNGKGSTCAMLEAILGVAATAPGSTNRPTWWTLKSDAGCAARLSVLQI